MTVGLQVGLHKAIIQLSWQMTTEVNMIARNKE